MGKPKGYDRSQLSFREAQVFHLAAQGMPTSQIADMLGLSLNTIHTYTSNIKKRLHLPPRVRLASIAKEENAQ